MRLDKTVSAVVSGGGSGLGEAVVRRLATAGTRVVIIDLPESRARALVDGLPSSVAFHPADVTDEEGVADAIEHAQSLGILRVAVNCAGVAPVQSLLGPDGPAPLQEFVRVLSINLVGTFNVMRLAAHAMSTVPLAEGERGVVVTTSSIAAFEGQIGQTAYSASKGGVVAMTVPAARELALHQIRVVSVAPGRFRTPLMESFHSQDALRRLAAEVPHPSRLGTPDEFAYLIEHVIANPMINGEVIRLDGALRMP